MAARELEHGVDGWCGATRVEAVLVVAEGSHLCRRPSAASTCWHARRVVPQRGRPSRVERHQPVGLQPLRHLGVRAGDHHVVQLLLARDAFYTLSEQTALVRLYKAAEVIKHRAWPKRERKRAPLLSGRAVADVSGVGRGAGAHGGT